MIIFSRNCKLSYYINHYPAYSCLKDEIFVEIKQNKEDMKEKKLNLRPFDLEAAKAGKPVYTRDGRKVRIICFDAKCIKPIGDLLWGLFLVVLSPASLIVIIIVELIESGFFKKVYKLWN